MISLTTSESQGVFFPSRSSALPEFLREDLLQQIKAVPPVVLLVGFKKCYSYLFSEENAEILVKRVESPLADSIYLCGTPFGYFIRKKIFRKSIVKMFYLI